MRILITGYKGFIGQNMVKAFADHELSLYERDDDSYSLDEVDRVIHLGAITDTTCDDWPALNRYNYEFSVRLIDDCQSREIPLQIASSASVYGIENITFRETDIVRPANLYAKSKVMVEDYVSNLELKAPVQLFRYFNVHGPHEDHKGSQASPFYKFRQQAKNGVIEVFEDSDKYRRDFIHVDQIIDLHKQFFAVEESGIWNFGTGKTVSFLEIAKRFASEYDAIVKEIPMPKNLAGKYQNYTKADLSKLQKTLRT
jgi:ADP-L-glycero-D-manno-heptose 6-epimerase